MSDLPGHEEVLAFWKEAGSEKWYKKDDEFDAEMTSRFSALHEAAAAGYLAAWQDDPDSCLALVIVLDQFSRNMFRNSARAFAQDDRALAIAGHALERGYDGRVDEEIHQFFYLPFMHDETLASQNRSVLLQHGTRNESGLSYAIIHRDIIVRFGRFPHRNPVLGRHTTPAEQAFLDEGGFSG
jgi:uncharacterized protein (DUF924 family)